MHVQSVEVLPVLTDRLRHYAFVALSVLGLGLTGTPASAQVLDCANAYASPNSLSPPNHTFAEIAIEGVIGADYLEVQCISQDEPLNADGDGNTEYDGDGIGEAVARVRRA